MTGYLENICEFAAGLNYRDLPAVVVERARFVMADSMAVIAAGARESEIKALTAEIDPATGPSTLLGLSRKADSLNAALINGAAGTFLELDEGNQFARGHPAIHVVPAILSMGEEKGLSGRALIVALVVGYEIGARIGIASKIRMSMHPHGTWGTVGAAAAAGRLAGLNPASMKEIINISSSMGLATSRQTMLQGGTVRNLYSGVSNYMGLLALKLLGAGFTGEKDGLSTVYGSVISDVFDTEAMTEDLGSRFEIARNYFKRHACCRYNHSALDALMDIASRFQNGRIPAGQIAKIEVETYSLAAQLCDPEPDNMLASKFSIPFAAATYLVHGDSGVDSFRADKTDNEEIKRLAGLTVVSEDPELTAMMPSRRPSRVALTMTDGTVQRAETYLNKGDFEDPYSEAEITAKYFELAESVWGRSKARSLHDGLMKLEEIENINELTAMLS